MHHARDGAIWFCAELGRGALKDEVYGNGAYRYDGETPSRLGEEDGLPSDEVFDIAETSDGTLWFATRKGLSKFNGATLVNFKKESQFNLPGND